MLCNQILFFHTIMKMGQIGPGMTQELAGGSVGSRLTQKQYDVPSEAHELLASRIVGKVLQSYIS